VDLDLTANPSGLGYTAVYHEFDLLDWGGPTGFYLADRRSLPAPEEGKTWDSLYVWAFPAYTLDTMFLSFEAVLPGRCQRDPPRRFSAPPSDRLYRLKLMSVPEGVLDAPPVGTVWELPSDSTFALELPTYHTTDGLEGYLFTFTITRVVPAPGDFDEDGNVDQDDYDQFVLCFTGSEGGPIDPGCAAGDIDVDDDVDCDDWNAFVQVWTGPPTDPPAFQPCAVCSDGNCDEDEDPCTCEADCGAPPASEVPGSTCADGLDNDCDSFTDCSDVDCQPCCGDDNCDAGEDPCTCAADCGAPPANEVPESTCTDDLDNDCDSSIDCDDPDCATDSECFEPPVPTASGWGVAGMMMLVLTVGTLILIRRHPVRV
jgi:hypothetical protein